jgi:Co/Zn/Cd efflux system component
MMVSKRYPDFINCEETVESLTTIEGIDAMHELDIWKLTENIRLAIIHIMANLRECHRW